MEHIVRARTAREIGAAIREARRKRGLTQEQLAVQAEVSRPWLVEVEHGHQRAELDKVLRVLAVLDLTLDLSPSDPLDLDLDSVLSRHEPRRRRG